MEDALNMAAQHFSPQIAMALVFLNHLCDGELILNHDRDALAFLNHLCDGER